MNLDKIASLRVVAGYISYLRGYLRSSLLGHALFGKHLFLTKLLFGGHLFLVNML